MNGPDATVLPALFAIATEFGVPPAALRAKVHQRIYIVKAWGW
ncbi:hypothetical protein [Nonomuraea insulae]|uniref:Uncharacterized protein n=1 Tax=Nonomuraea insulae TaxID=1616787 RepID=A0ABW1CNE1_9ACTN